LIRRNIRRSSFLVDAREYCRHVHHVHVAVRCHRERSDPSIAFLSFGGRRACPAWTGGADTVCTMGVAANDVWSRNRRVRGRPRTRNHFPLELLSAVQVGQSSIPTIGEPTVPF